MKDLIKILILAPLLSYGWDSHSQWAMNSSRNVSSTAFYWNGLGYATNYWENGTNFQAIIWTNGVGGLTIPQSKHVDILVVAGGAGGGGKSGRGGGGGAGGVIVRSVSISAGTVAVSVGTGGAGGASAGVRGGNGSNSLFGAFISYGGGGGGTGPSGNTPDNRDGLGGGSGGGAADYNGSGLVGIATNGQGFAGGLGVEASPAYGAGGGGGYSTIGGNGGATYGGNGGNGLTNSFSGMAKTYAGGGGGDAANANGGTGGIGGGGNGGNNSIGPTSGVANTGGGGGGGGDSGSRNGGDGGSGIVIARWSKGISKYAIPFNGVDNFLDLGSISTFSGATDVTNILSVLYRVDKVNSAYNTVMGSFDAPNYRQMNVSAGNTWEGDYSSTAFPNGGSPATNNWYFLRMCNTNFSVNGIQISSAYSATMLFQTKSLYLGARHDTSGATNSFCGGAIAEAQLIMNGIIKWHGIAQPNGTFFDIVSGTNFIVQGTLPTSININSVSLPTVNWN